MSKYGDLTCLGQIPFELACWLSISTCQSITKHCSFPFETCIELFCVEIFYIKKNLVTCRSCRCCIYSFLGGYLIENPTLSPFSVFIYSLSVCFHPENGAWVAEWSSSWFKLTCTDQCILSPIRREFAPVFVPYKNGLCLTRMAHNIVSQSVVLSGYSGFLHR